MKKEHIEHLILGAGLAGLTAAFQLKSKGHRSFAVLEAQPFVGGLLRTHTEQGIAIDHLPHVFFTRDESCRTLYLDIVPHSIKQRSSIGVFVRDRYIDYPFQLNVHGLDQSAKLRCLEGYFDTLLERHAQRTPRTFQEYVRCTYGAGMEEVFFRPYNEKLWCTPMEKMSVEWVGPKIDPVSSADMARGFLGCAEGEDRMFGPHAEFYYPESGGIQTLAENVAARVGMDQVHVDEKVVSIDTKKKIVRTSRREWQYDKLISTLPLHTMAELTGKYHTDCARLSYNTVLTVHIVADAVVLPEYHWIYYADADIPFYRITRVDMVDKRYQGGPVPLIIECAFPGNASVDRSGVLASVKQALLKLGILSAASRISFENTFQYGPAYVIYDLAYRRTVTALRERLRRDGIIVAGRFGEWAFYNMDMTMRSAIRAVEDVLS